MGGRSCFGTWLSGISATLTGGFGRGGRRSPSASHEQKHFPVSAPCAIPNPSHRTSGFGSQSVNVKQSQKCPHNTRLDKGHRKKVKTIISTFPARIVPLSWSLLHLLEGKGHCLITSVISVSEGKKTKKNKTASGSSNVSFSGFIKNIERSLIFSPPERWQACGGTGAA